MAKHALSYLIMVHWFDHLWTTNMGMSEGMQVLSMGSANQSRRYNVRSSLIGWARSQYNPWYMEASHRWPNWCILNFCLNFFQLSSSWVHIYLISWCLPLLYSLKRKCQIGELCRHLLCRKLSFWELQVQSVATNAPTWRFLHLYTRPVAVPPQYRPAYWHFTGLSLMNAYLWNYRTYLHQTNLSKPFRTLYLRTISFFSLCLLY